MKIVVLLVILLIVLLIAPLVTTAIIKWWINRNKKSEPINLTTIRLSQPTTIKELSSDLAQRTISWKSWARPITANFMKKEKTLFLKSFSTPDRSDLDRFYTIFNGKNLKSVFTDNESRSSSDNVWAIHKQLTALIEQYNRDTLCLYWEPDAIEEWAKLIDLSPISYFAVTLLHYCMDFLTMHGSEVYRDTDRYVFKPNVYQTEPAETGKNQITNVFRLLKNIYETQSQDSDDRNDENRHHLLTAGDVIVLHMVAYQIKWSLDALGIFLKVLKRFGNSTHQEHEHQYSCDNISVTREILEYLFTELGELLDTKNDKRKEEFELTLSAFNESSETLLFSIQKLSTGNRTLLKNKYLSEFTAIHEFLSSILNQFCEISPLSIKDGSKDSKFNPKWNNIEPTLENDLVSKHIANAFFQIMIEAESQSVAPGSLLNMFKQSFESYKQNVLSKSKESEEQQVLDWDIINAPEGNVFIQRFWAYFCLFCVEYWAGIGSLPSWDDRYYSILILFEIIENKFQEYQGAGEIKSQIMELGGKIYDKKRSIDRISSKSFKEFVENVTRKQISKIAELFEDVEGSEQIY
jgi:hypothetical protein